MELKKKKRILLLGSAFRSRGRAGRGAEPSVLGLLFPGGGTAGVAHRQDGCWAAETRPAGSRGPAGGTLETMATAGLARMLPSVARAALHTAGGLLPLPSRGGHHLLGHSQGGM